MNYKQATEAYAYLMARKAFLAAASLAIAERLEVGKIYVAIEAASTYYFNNAFAAVRDEAVEAMIIVSAAADKARREARVQLHRYMPNETVADRHARGLRASYA